MIGTISIGNLSIFVQFVVLVTKVQMCRETAYFSTTTTTAKRRTIFQKIWKNHMIVRNRERNNDCRLHIFSHLGLLRWNGIISICCIGEDNPELLNL